MAVIDQAEAAVAEGAALGGAPVVHAAVGLVFGPVVGVIRAGGFGDGVNLRAGVQVLVGCPHSGGALVGQSGNGQPQAQRQGQQKGYRFFHPCFLLSVLMGARCALIFYDSINSGKNNTMLSA